MAKKSLVVYYSWSNGNTEGIARQLAASMGADVERIDTAKPYPSDHERASEQGRREVEEGFQPALKPLAHDPADYDMVVVGTPTWWYSMAPAVLTYLRAHDWAGKTVVPFMTNAGWPGTVIEDMEAAVEGADVRLPHEFRFARDGGPQMVTPQSELDEWAGKVAALAK